MILEAFRATVAGLSELNVQVEPVNLDAEADGLSRADLQGDVEELLRAAGFSVLDPSRLFADTVATPVLHLDVMAVKTRERYLYSVRLELWQAVRLVRDPRHIALGVTWFAPQLVGEVSRESLGTVRDAVRSAVEQFIQDARVVPARR